MSKVANNTEDGIAIDGNSNTVLLIGKGIIDKLLGLGGMKQTLADFNKLAVSIVKLYGPTYGVDPETIDADDWCLATTTPEDTMCLLSYLEDPRAELALGKVAHDIGPVKEAKKWLH